MCRSPIINKQATSEMRTHMFTAPEGITILTTKEHADFFRAAIDGDIDFRIKSYECLPLDIFLGNVAISKGKIVVLDEDYFIDSTVLTDGLAKFLNSPENPTTRLQLICVCASRKAGDVLLQQLVSYFSIFDIVYGCACYEIGQRTLWLINKPNKRINIVDLLPPLAKIAQADNINDNEKANAAQNKTEEIPNGYIGSPVKQKPKEQDTQIQNGKNILHNKSEQDKTSQPKENIDKVAESPMLKQTENASNSEEASVTKDSQVPHSKQTTSGSSVIKIPNIAGESGLIGKFEIDINLKIMPTLEENNSTEE